MLQLFISITVVALQFWHSNVWEWVYLIWIASPLASTKRRQLRLWEFWARACDNAWLITSMKDVWYCYNFEIFLNIINKQSDKSHDNINFASFEHNHTSWSLNFNIVRIFKNLFQALLLEHTMEIQEVGSIISACLTYQSTIHGLTVEVIVFYMVLSMKQEIMDCSLDQ